jgi:CBS domain-containing protein
MVLVAKDIMETDVLTIDGSVDALSCARTMAERHKGYAILLEGGAISGIVTEWDFLSKIVAPARDASRVPIREIATAVVDACAPNTPTDEVVSTMAQRGIRRMVVRSGDRVLGVITARDVLKTFRAYVDQISAEIAANQSQASPLG